MATTWANTSLLKDHRRRALALFPELETCGSEFFTSMSLYTRETPWKFYDRGTATRALEVLKEIRATDDRLLVSFFKDRYGEIELAVRSLDEINRASFHDREWWTLGDLEQICDIRELIHPAYLQLCEAVLKTLLHPIAVFHRRKGGSMSETFNPDERIEAARRVGISAFEPLDSRVRNAIAHGSVAFAKDAIEYRNVGAKGPRARRTTPSETLRLFEDLLDICNGLAVAYRLLVLLDAKLLFSESAPIPPALVFPEVQHQLDTVGWHVRDYLVYDYGNGERDLNLFVSTSYFDDHKTRLSVIRAAVFASRFMPAFDRCYVRLARRGRIGGWGLFETAKVRELLQQGVADGPSFLNAVPGTGFIVFPLCRYFKVAGPLRLIGSIIEVIRTSWPVLRTREQRPEVRYVRTVGKRTYARVTATTVLHIEDLQTAMQFVANNVRSLLREAVKEGWRQPETSKWLRWLPVGYVEVDVHRSDRRRRQLVSSGLDANLLCRIVRKSRGQIQIIPLHESVPQEIGGVKIFWNRAAIEPLIK
jgi:hypothetical protein